MAQDKINTEVEINHDNAVLLLAAAQEMGLDASVVETADGTFRVPQEVVDKAGVGKKGKAPSAAKVEKAADAVVNADPPKVEDPAHPEPEKKTPAKRTPAKRTAKKAPAKKAAATEQKSE